jgi:LTXXQ motif family protein
MKSFSRFLVPTLLALSISSSFAAAQTAGTAASPKRERPSAETIQRLQDGKLAGALATLKLNDAQAKLWVPVEAQIRARQADRIKMMQARADRKPDAARPALSDRMSKMAERMAARADKAKAFAAVFTPFYASLTDSMAVADAAKAVAAGQCIGARVAQAVCRSNR